MSQISMFDPFSNTRGNFYVVLDDNEKIMYISKLKTFEIKNISKQLNKPLLKFNYTNFFVFCSNNESYKKKYIEFF
jgi:hypothetical protein